MKVEIGQKIYGQYGAMIPTVYGIVDRIEDDIVYFYDRYEPEMVYTTPVDYIKPLLGDEMFDEVPLAIGVYAKETV